MSAEDSSLSRVATFSFFGNKIFTCGEGEAITLSDPHLALRARTLKRAGRRSQPALVPRGVDLTREGCFAVIHEFWSWPGNIALMSRLMPDWSHPTP